MSERSGVRTSRLIGAAGLGVVVSGVVVNVYLAVVARALSPAEYVSFGAFWSLGLVVGFGPFLPVEQELARRLQAAPDRRAQLGAAAVAAAGGAVLALAALAALSPLVLRSLGGEAGAFAALAVLCVVSGAQFLLRGTLIGGNRLVRHGAVMVLDALLRLALAVGLFLLGGHSATAFCWTLVAAIALAHVPLLPGAVRRAAAADPVAVAGDPPGGPLEGPAARRGAVLDRTACRSFAGAALPLLAGSVCAQLLLNGLPVLVAALATPADQVAAGIFVAAFTLARAPLSIVVPLQSAVVPTLTRLLAEGRRAQVRALLLRGAAALVALAAVGMPAAALIGPAIVRLVFGARYDIAGLDLALIIGGVLAHIGLVVMTQVHVARAEHRAVAMSWVAALLAAGITFVAVGNLLRAAELAFGVGSAAGALVAVLLLFVHHPREVRHV